MKLRISSKSAKRSKEKTDKSNEKMRILDREVEIDKIKPWDARLSMKKSRDTKCDKSKSNEKNNKYIEKEVILGVLIKRLIGIIDFT